MRGGRVMQHEAVNGVVVRVRDMGDHDRYLSVLTADRGRITLLSKGSRSMRGHQMAVSQLFCYSNLEFYRRGTLPILKGGTPIHPFYEISMDIDRLNLASYLCDLTCELTDEGEEAGNMLRLLLNSLYAIARDLYPQEIVKGAFEWRALAMSGYEPDLDGCHRCGANDTDALYVDVMNGGVLCGECLHKKGSVPRADLAYDDIREAEVLCPVTPATLAALRYVQEAPLERIFTFELTDPEALRLFAACAETYALSHIGHSFETLNFYHALKDPKKGTKL